MSRGDSEWKDAGAKVSIDVNGVAQGIRYPVLPVRDLVLFPSVIVPLFVGRPHSLKAIETALAHDKKLFVVAQKKVATDDPLPADLYSVGTLGNILQMVKMPDGMTKILVEGTERAKVERFQHGYDGIMASLSAMPWNSLTIDRAMLKALKRRVWNAFEQYNSLQPKIPDEVMASVADIEDAGQLVDLISSHLTVELDVKQKLLEVDDLESAMLFLLKVLQEESHIMELEHDIHDRVRSALERNQREYYLREQLKIIQGELGQNDDSDDIENYRQKISALKMSEDATEKANRELTRLIRMPAMSPEAVVVRSYLDWLLDMPWNVRTEDNTDLARASRFLNEDHYGLDKVKDRILEFLAVRQRAGRQMQAQIICFVGPPGVGKTSLGRSIARALSRNFVNVSLGGVYDEAEIRGHRRTYIGSLPGRIVQKMVKAKSCNPVMLLDEIDKMGSDFRGDPASALLEALDPQQNFNFTDHYLEVPFDLSEVLFITTANVTHSIPKPLLDRMEVIALPGYTAPEKVQIAVRHLLPKVLREHGLTRGDVKMSPAVIAKIVASYTREAGVRGLERQLATVARKITRRLAENTEAAAVKTPVTVKVSDLKDYLGAPKLYDTVIPREPQVGSVVGLAWTEAGGDVLMIEAVTMKGKGELFLTGSLGDVMQESAKAAVSFLRSESAALGLGDFDWKSVDIHLHVPDGAVPKDGPSAGITIATAILSAVSGRAVLPGIAMTGEISLRGQVLPIGGVREKLLSARRYGIFHVILPEADRADVAEIAADVLEGMTLDYVTDVMSVFKKALSS